MNLRFLKMVKFLVFFQAKAHSKLNALCTLFSANSPSLTLSVNPDLALISVEKLVYDKLITTSQGCGSGKS